jgi:hypothetical protein
MWRNTLKYNSLGLCHYGDDVNSPFCIYNLHALISK